MTRQLEGLLRQCTVLLADRKGTAAGSGFFVAPGLVLTAAHVVGKANTDVRVFWGGEEVPVSEVEWQVPAEGTGTMQWDLPDMALIRLEEGAAVAHPCVYLDEQVRGPELLAEGYTRGTGQERTPDSARLVFETVRDGGPFSVVKCKDSVVDDGLSGGPLLDLTSGRVIGVTKAQRSMPFTGGTASGIAALRQLRPEVWAENRRFHHTNHRWEFARLNHSDTGDPAVATTEFLERLKGTIARRPAILPPDGTRSEIHQMPSVRALQRGDKGAGRQDGGSPVVPTGATTRFEGVFQWAPLRSPWAATLLLGLPGHGKSWLLNIHAETIADDVLRRIVTDETSWMSSSVPVVVDCAILAKALPAKVTRESLLGALVDTISQEIESTGVPVGAVVRVAYESGRLISCLDALDEVRTADREKMRQAFPILVEHGNRLLVTSRPSGVLGRQDMSVLPNCFTAEVIGFTPGQVFAFARGWFSTDPERSQQLETELLSRPELNNLAKVPLMAAFLCGLAGENDRLQLPGSRTEIYRSVMLDALSGRWRAQRSQVIDPESPPDAELRLRVLTSVVGRLSRPWRSRIDRFSRKELSAALRDHPEYEQAEAQARARWYLYQTLQNVQVGQALVPPVEPLLWEYLFDGIIAHDIGEGDQTIVRFAHPVLAEYCVAAHVAEHDEASLLELVEEHRWFDAGWDEVWQLIAMLSEDPDSLILQFLECPNDAWFEQTSLAGRCLAAAGNRVSPEVRTRVLSRLLAGIRSWRPFDRERSVARMGELIRSGVEEARSHAHVLLNTELRVETRVRLVSALAEAGDPEGLTLAGEVIADLKLPTTYRAWCARSVVIAEDDEGVERLFSAVKGSRTVEELRVMVNAIPIEGKAGNDLAGKILRDQDVDSTIRVVVGTALIRIGGEDRIALVKEVAGTPLTNWGVRAPLISELLAVGEDDMISTGVELFDDPGLSAEQRVDLVEALIRRGQLTVLDRATRLLTRGDVVWPERKRLARALAQLGQEGIERLKQVVRSPLALHLKMRHIIALVEVGEDFDLAVSLVEDTGAPSWIRTRVAASLLERGYPATPVDVLWELATEPEPDHQFQGELVSAMVSRKIPGAEEAALAFFASPAETFTHREFSQDLANAGTGGRGVLTRVVSSPDIPEVTRALAVISLADSDPQEAARLARSLDGRLSAFVEQRITLLLAERGVVELADRLVGLLEEEPEAYLVLFHLLNSARASRELVDRLLLKGEEVTKEPPPELRGEVEFDLRFFDGIGVDWRSRQEREKAEKWFIKTVNNRAAEKFVAFLGKLDRELFSQFDSRDLRGRFIVERVMEFPGLIQEEVERLEGEVRQNPELLPRIRPEGKLPAITFLSHLCSILEEWVSVTLKEGASEGISFFVRNRSMIVSEPAVVMLKVAASMTKQHFFYEGAEKLVLMALRDEQDALQFMNNSDQRQELLSLHLDNGNGPELFSVACAGVLLNPDSEVMYFYGSLGAFMLGMEKISLIWMIRSGLRADPWQKQQGHNTLNTTAARFDWRQEIVDKLHEALDFAEDAEAGGTDDGS